MMFNMTSRVDFGGPNPIFGRPESVVGVSIGLYTCLYHFVSIRHAFRETGTYAYIEP